MNAKNFYAFAAFGALAWLHYWADDPKEMVMCGLIAAGSFTMYAIEVVDERMNRMQATIERLWKRVEPSMFRDSGL